jgi:hypothetical protein
MEPAWLPPVLVLLSVPLLMFVAALRYGSASSGYPMVVRAMAGLAAGGLAGAWFSPPVAAMVGGWVAVVLVDIIEPLPLRRSGRTTATPSPEALDPPG